MAKNIHFINKLKVSASALIVAGVMLFTPCLSLIGYADETDYDNLNCLDTYTVEQHDDFVNSLSSYRPGVVLDASYIDEEDGFSSLTDSCAYSKSANIEGIRDFITNCYRIALDREPDAESLEGWSNKLANREAFGVSVVFGFVYSNEFQNAGYDDDTYVEKMYSLLLGRSSDQEGKAYWLNQLSNGVDREAIISGFANSVEFFNLCDSYGIFAGYYIPGAGMERNERINGFVNRLYRICLGRDGDMAGHASWVVPLANGSMSGADAAHGFIFSPEFIAANHTSSSFVGYLYQAFFNRDAASSEVNGWCLELERGFKTRERVFDSFANSAEFTNLCDSYGIVRGNSSYGTVYSNGEEHGSVLGFDDLYEIADIVGDRYGVEIAIADEVSYELATLDDCFMGSCYDYDKLYDALVCLDEYMSYYPEGYFVQIAQVRSKSNRHCIYICGDPDEAAGVTWIDGLYGDVVGVGFAVDCIIDDCTTFVHELAHCTDRALIYRAGFDSSIDFSDVKWNTFNPDGFVYPNTYDIDYEDYYDSDYFVRMYGTTYATEDRAVLMEVVMLYYSCGMKVDLPDPLYAKAEYYFTAIRTAFANSNWPEVTSWEWAALDI